jgi:hypothetical protein
VTGLTPSSVADFTSHLVRPEVVLALARHYYGRSPQAFLLGIRGYAFEFVEELTAGAAVNLQLAVSMLTERTGRQPLEDRA